MFKHIPTTYFCHNLGVVSLFGVIFVMMIGLMLSLIVFGMELYYAWQFRMFQVRLRTRRAMAEPVHLMALARLFAGPEIQQKLDEQFERPTLPELQAHFGELYIWYSVASRPLTTCTNDRPVTTLRICSIFFHVMVLNFIFVSSYYRINIAFFALNNKYQNFVSELISMNKACVTLVFPEK